eukprot:scaffold94607_cov27-Tisochrysis_lutea.AAC.1
MTDTGSTARCNFINSTSTRNTSGASGEAIISRSGARRSMRFCRAATSGIRWVRIGLESRRKESSSSATLVAPAMKARTASTRSRDGFCNTRPQVSAPTRMSQALHEAVARSGCFPPFSRRATRIVTRNLSTVPVPNDSGGSRSPYRRPVGVCRSRPIETAMRPLDGDSSRHLAPTPSDLQATRCSHARRGERA